MEQEPGDNKNTSMSDKSSANQRTEKTSKRPLLMILGIFVVLVIIVFLTQKKASISWVTDYDTAVQMARQQNKPMLLAFYRPNEPMVTDTFNNTYRNPDVKKFVESNFVPVLINTDEKPDLARKFKINYYPTHYVKHPDNNELFGPRLGWDPPKLFINEITKLLNRMHESMK